MDAIYLPVSLRMLSHELRTAITDILGNLNLLQEETLAPEQNELIQKTLQSSQYLLGFIEYLLAEAKHCPILPAITHEECFHKPAVLIVEDEPLIQRVHTKMLEKLGYAVSIANNGYQALTMLNKHYDAILMDIGLPGMSGIETTMHIRELELNNNQAIPIIGVTAYGEESVKEECQVAGFTKVVTKPIDMYSLGAILQQLVHSKTFNQAVNC